MNRAAAPPAGASILWSRQTPMPAATTASLCWTSHQAAPPHSSHQGTQCLDALDPPPFPAHHVHPAVKDEDPIRQVRQRRPLPRVLRPVPPQQKVVQRLPVHSHWQSELWTEKGREGGRACGDT